MTVGSSSTGIGAPVVRREDHRFLTGQGRFADDINLPGMAWACVVSSPHAHARIPGIDVAAARAAPGVLAVLTGRDAIEEKLGCFPCHAFPPLPAGSPYYRPLQPILAAGKVRHVGDRVACVVAETLQQARLAAELLAVTYEPLPPVTRGDALQAG